jgi:hypothetical protein
MDAPLDEKHQEIADQVFRLFELIRTSKEALEKVRAPCEHPITTEGYWEWGGVGRVFPASICKVCQMMVKPLTGKELDDFMCDREAERQAALKKMGY